MGKRKRDATTEGLESLPLNGKPTKTTKINGHVPEVRPELVLQIVTGSYERVLHGIIATLPASSSTETSPSSVQFTDSFLFNAHSSAIRCLAVSPLQATSSAESQNVLLASGGTDERINVYSLSALAPIENARMPPIPTLVGNRIIENPQNRELGSLLHHSSSVTSLCFPTRSKLLSASEDNTIAISRAKDLTVVSTVKAPHPKVQGQPSGDTAPSGATPAGINDFTVHPSLKLMVSVGRGEKCMRLWNLVTGKRAGALNFDREVLQSVREGKYSSGEGRRIEWSLAGSEFAVAFERGVIIFGEDSKPRCRILPQPLTKVHQIRFVSRSDENASSTDCLAVSTEDGRILFYAIDQFLEDSDTQIQQSSFPDAIILAQLGGREAGVTNRIKDFEILPILKEGRAVAKLIIVSACSDGSIRVWEMPNKDLLGSRKAVRQSGTALQAHVLQVGKMLGMYETASRITCLKAFSLLPNRDNEGLSGFEGLTEEEKNLSESDSDSQASP